MSNLNSNDNMLMAMLMATTSSPILTQQVFIAPAVTMPSLTMSPAIILQEADYNTATTPEQSIESPTMASVMVTQYSFQGTTLKTPTTSDHILLGICFIIGVLGIVGNAVMVISILAVRSFRQASNIFFFHHGLLEIAKSALIIPFALSITGKRASYCELLGAMQCVLVTTTSLNLAAITINQSFIISHAIPGANIADEHDSSGSPQDDSSKRKKKKSSSSQKGPSALLATSSNQAAIKIIPALESGTMNKPSLKRNITCVVFGVLLIWMASLVLNMGVSLITGSGQYNEKIGLCYFVYGHQKSYVVNVMWIVVTSLGVAATIGCLRKLKVDLRRSQEYRKLAFRTSRVLQTFPNTIKATNTRHANEGASHSKSLPQSRNIQASATLISVEQQQSPTTSAQPPINNNKRSSKSNENSKSAMKNVRSTAIDERYQQRLNAMISKQAFQQTRLLNCQFNVIVLQTISFIIFWYPLFGLIIADKEFMVDTEIYKALTVLAWLNAPLTPVFFTYFNYECYSTQVAVRLSVIGDATAQVVREQALIAEKLVKPGEIEKGRVAEEEVVAEKQQPATILNSKLRQPPPPPPPLLKSVSQRITPFNFGQVNHPKPYYYQESFQPQQPMLSTFRPPKAQPYMGRSLHDLPQSQQEGIYWFERRDLSSNSLHQLNHQDNQMPRTETFPKFPIEEEMMSPGNMQHPYWSKPAAPTSRSLREINRKPQQTVRFPVLPLQKNETSRNCQYQVDDSISPTMTPNNRPHSYENINNYTFDETRRSKTAFDNRYRDDDEDSEESEEERPQPIIRRRLIEQNWAAKQKLQMKKDRQNMCSWRQIANKQQVTHGEMAGEKGAVPKKIINFAGVKKNGRSSPSKQHFKRSDSEQASSEDDNNQTRPRPPTPIRVHRQETTTKKTVLTSPTDQEVPKILQGFKNPLYIEAFRRANMLQQQAMASEEDRQQAIPMVEVSHRRSDTPQLRFVSNQEPWNRSINETEDEVFPSSGTRADSLANNLENGTEEKMTPKIDGEKEKHKDAIEPLTTTTVTSPGSQVETVGYTKIESHVQTAGGTSVDRLQIWLGKLDNNQQQSAATSPPIKNDKPAPAKMPTTTSLIDDFKSRHQHHQQQQQPQSPQSPVVIDNTLSSVMATVDENSSGNDATISPKSSPKQSVTSPSKSPGQAGTSGEKSGATDQREVWI